MSGGGYVPLSPVRQQRSGGSGIEIMRTENEVHEPLLSPTSIFDNPYNETKQSSSIQNGHPGLLAPTPRYAQPGSTTSTSSFPPRLPSPSPPTAPVPSILLSLNLSPTTISFIQRNTGLLLVASSQFFFVFMNLSAKFFVSTTSISTLTLILVRMVITALGCLFWLSISGNPNPFLGPPEPHVRRLLMWRGFFGFGGLFCNYQSLRGLSVSDSTTIQFLAPNLTALLGFLVLGETMGWREVGAGLACLGGVVLVSRPPFLFGSAASLGTEDIGGVVIPEEGTDAGTTHSDRMVAVGWAFAAVCSATCAYVTIRKIGKQAHAMHSMLYFCYSCIITSTIGLLVKFRSFVFIQTWREFWLIMLIGVFGFVAQMLLTYGLQREKAGRASLAMYLSLLYSLILELILFGTVPPFLSVLGGAIIIISAVWVAVTKPSEPAPRPTQSTITTDEESLPFSRSPSPIPQTGRTIRGESYSYASVPNTESQGSGPNTNGHLQPNDVYFNGKGEAGSADDGESERLDQLGEGGMRDEGRTGLRIGGSGKLPRRRSGGSGKSIQDE